jgi:Short C-terminal domain
VRVGCRGRGRTGPRLAVGSFSLDRRSPEQILDERFARGEIDIEEYTRRRQLLHPGHGPGQPSTGQQRWSEDTPL